MEKDSIGEYIWTAHCVNIQISQLFALEIFAFSIRHVNITFKICTKQLNSRKQISANLNIPAYGRGKKIKGKNYIL